MTRFRWLAIIVLGSMVIVAGCGRKISPQPGRAQGNATPPAAGAELHPSPLGRELMKRCPLPAWWDSVSAPRVSTYSDLLRYWQSQSFTPEELFKVCYTALVEHLDDRPPDVAMLAASLISNGDPTYRHYGDLYGFILEHFQDYDRPLVNYGGAAGDTVAGIVETYAGLLLGQGRYGEARDVVEDLLQRRKREINPHLLQQLSLELARAYVGLGNRDRARAVLTEALTYPGDWTQQVQQALQRL